MSSIQDVTQKSNLPRLNDAIRYVMHSHDFKIIDYIDDYIGVVMPNVLSQSFVS